VSQNHINPEFQKLVRPEEIGLPGFYDTLDEARGVLRTLVNAVFPDPDQNDIFAMRDLQWTTTRDTELVERGNLVDVWLEQTAGEWQPLRHHGLQVRHLLHALIPAQE
jgi:hypothetical protein